MAEDPYLEGGGGVGEVDPMILPQKAGAWLGPGPSDPGPAYLAPDPRITAGKVRSRFEISSQSDQLSM